MKCELGGTKILWGGPLTTLLILSFLDSGASDGFANGIADVTSDNLYNLLEPKIQDLIVSKHLDPTLLSNVTFDYPVLPTVFLYNGNLTGLSQFHNESVRSSWDPHSRMVNMQLQLIFPELKMSYQWRSLMGKGIVFYYIYDMLLDLSFVLDLQSLQLRIQDVRFNNYRATTDIAVRSKIVTNILNALRNRLKGLNNWVLNPVTEKMNQAIFEEVRIKNIDIYELLGIKHLYRPTTVDPDRYTVDPERSTVDLERSTVDLERSTVDPYRSTTVGLSSNRFTADPPTTGNSSVNFLDQSTTPVDPSINAT